MAAGTRNTPGGEGKEEGSWDGDEGIVIGGERRGQEGREGEGREREGWGGEGRERKGEGTGTEG